MTADSSQRLIARLKSFSKYTGLIVAAAGGLVLCGWIFDLRPLKNVLPGFPTMKFNTAAGFILSGLALWLGNEQQSASRKKQWLGGACAAAVVLVGLATLGEYLFGFNLGIDQWIVPDPETPAAFYPGRMPITTALNFTLLGAALLLLEVEPRRSFHPAQLLALFAGAVASIALIGHLYGVESLYSVGGRSSMALHTALSFALLSMGVVCARPQRGFMRVVLAESAGGVILRRLFPVAVIIPIVIGWLRLSGQQLGWYDTNFGLALMVMLSITALSAVVWLNAGWLDRLDANRRRAEEAVRKSQLQLASIINTAMDAIITIDENQRILIFNPAAEVMFRRFADKMIGKPLTLLIPERLRPSHEEDVRAFGRASITKRSMGRLGMVYGLRANGEEFPLEVSISQTESGGRKTFTAILRDITERRQAEQALRESEERFRSVLDSMLEGFQIIGFDWRHLYINDAAVKQGQRTREELLGHTMMEIDPGIEDTPLFSMLRRCMEDRTSQSMENEFLYPDGSKAWLQLVVQPAPEGLFLLSSDITQRKRAEEALRESERKFTIIYEKLPFAGALSRFPDGVIVDVNEEFERAFGYPKPEVVGRTSLELRINPDSEGRARLAAELQARGSVRNMELTLFTKSGAARVFLMNIDRVEIGGQKYVLQTAQDITERKRAEEELNRLNAELERRVRDRTGQLEAANKELEAFSYSVSHDLRAPLRGIDGFSQALLRESADGLDEQGKHYLGRILENTRRMGQLINDLLELSRVTRRELTRERVELSALANQISAELKAQQPGRKAEFVIADHLTAEGDPHLLRVALQNLFDNAWKFTSTRPLARIELGLTKEKSGHVFFVRDNGVGFDMAYADKLFGAFQRLHSMHEFPGTGVGLATVQRIIHRHGGRIWPEAAVGAGATFYFTLGEDEHEGENDPAGRG